MSYSYWNNFIDAWKALPTAQYSNLNPNPPYNQINGWTNPNLEPLMNSKTPPSHYSLEYLPEPWWGNDGSHALHSVVINYNPGLAYDKQHFTTSNGLFGHNDYQTFLDSEATGTSNHFTRTNKWHKSKRADRIFKTLSNISILPSNHNLGLHNHLSIELIPWHTEDTSTINSYIKSNLQAIFDYSIQFAANESRRIANSKLKNKVILRISGSKAGNLLNEFANNGICQHSVINPIGSTPCKEGKFFKFSINCLNNVEFICIWSIRGNDFPPQSAMDWIFQNII